jgi:Zn-dependent M28 family amino/carboxypeptidase
MASLRGKLTHTVRFCFFNAEEAGLVGSKAYAASLKAQNAPVIGTICMDMIGYNSDANRLWEVHAGYTDPAIRDASVPLAQSVADAAQDYGALPPAQIYQGTSSTSGSPDRSLYDGAINRSDHAAFHQQGWPAVVVSEDFFANLATEPAADGNVNYHRAGDTFVDIGYARDIVCAVARAVTLRAQ